MMSPKGKITVVIAEDTEIGRRGLNDMFETSQGIKVIGEAITAKDAMRITKELNPQVVLMDMKWYDDETAGVRAIKEIKKSSPEVKIIAITAYPNLISEAWLAGADNAVTKNLKREELLKLIEGVFDQSISSNFQENNPINKDGLSPHEREVLQLIADGKSEQETASLFGISTLTVTNHVKNILVKLNATNIEEAIKSARELNLII